MNSCGEVLLLDMKGLKSMREQRKGGAGFLGGGTKLGNYMTPMTRTSMSGMLERACGPPEPGLLGG